MKKANTEINTGRRKKIRPRISQVSLQGYSISTVGNDKILNQQTALYRLKHFLREYTLQIVTTNTE